MSKGKIWLNKGPAPNYLALIVICLKADFLMCGVPSLILSKSSRILLYFCSSMVKSSSFLFSRSGAKNLYYYGLIGGKSYFVAFKLSVVV